MYATNRPPYPPEKPPSDYLTETTRKVRRALLVTWTVSIAYTWVGLVPERIAIFGLESSQIDQSKLTLLLLTVLLYFMVEFILLARRDYIYLLYNREPRTLSPPGESPARDLPDPAQTYLWAFGISKLPFVELTRWHEEENPQKRELATRMRFPNIPLKYFKWLLLPFMPRMTVKVFPVPRYGLLALLDFWLPLALTIQATICLSLWEPTS